MPGTSVTSRMCALFAGTLALPMAARAAPVDWSGVYGGLVGGYSSGFSTQNSVNLDFASGQYAMRGAFVDLAGGFNYQFGRWTLGLDTEIGKAGIKGAAGAAASSRLDSLFIVRARFGYSVGDFLPFIGLGPAYGGFSTYGALPAGPISDHSIRPGWTFSAGVDYRLTPSVFARAEYMYICFGEAVARNTDIVALMGHYGRIGLFYQFNSEDLKKANVEAEEPSAGGAYDWTGIHIGPFVGGSAFEQATTFSANGSDLGLGTHTNAGGIRGFGLQGTLGFQAGANWRLGPAIVGVETDFQLSQLTRAGRTPHLIATVGGSQGHFAANNLLPESGSFRLRAGLPIDRWLIYVTGGIAYGAIESDTTLTTAGARYVASEDTTKLGPIAGIGVERAVWGDWTTRLEYMYANFGRVAYAFQTVAPFNAAGSKTDIIEHILRVGFNWKFR